MAAAESKSHENYALVFWIEEPRSADVVLKKDVLPDPAHPFILPGQLRRVLWQGTPYRGRIISTGKKGDLLKIKLSRDGEWLEERGPDILCLTTRKRALSIVEARAARANATATEQLDMSVLVASEAPANPPYEVPQQHLHELENAVKELNCYKEPNLAEKNNYVEMVKGVFVLKEDLGFLLRKHKKKPVKLFTAVLELFLTEELIKKGAFSLSGKGKGTVKLPQDIFKAALNYCTLNSKGKEFDPTKSVTNMLQKAKAKNNNNLNEGGDD